MTKKAHPGKPERTHNHHKFTTESRGGQGGPISRYLLPGQDNAITLRNLEIITDMDGRTVRKLIERERRAGVPILADNSSGYYLPGEEGDIAVWVRSMKHRAKEIAEVADAVAAGRFE